MKEYKYTIIRRESRNPKRNREGRGISESDLEALRQELAGDQHATVTTIREGLELADTTAEDLRKRLGTAEEELRKKLGSEDFKQWRKSELEPSLAGKASTVDVKQSAQRAIAEAVKRAGEMDKEIKVGGRNLLIGERFSKETTPSREIWLGNITSIIDNNNLIGETVTWSFDLKCDKAYTFSVYQLGTIWFTDYEGATVEAGTWKRFSFTGVVRDTGNPTGSADRACTLTIYGNYGSGYFPITRRHKLERGTVATDWTPAPEDVAESVSKVSTSVTDLKRTLLDPDQGEIHKLAGILNKHKEDTDKNFDDLANHPPTIDKDDLWQFWDVRKQKYVPTQYKSRGEDGKDAGRYLGRAKRIHPDLNGNYLLDKEDSWRTAEEGDYVYLVGDAPNRGGDKETFYIVREHKGNTVWEVYDIKGRKVSIEWNGTSLIVDDQPPVDLRGEAGHTPKLHVGEDDYLYIDGVKQRYIRGRQGEPGHNPDPEDVLRARGFEEMLDTAVWEEVKPVRDNLDTATTNIADLSKRSLTLQQKKDLSYLTGSIRALMSGGSGTEQTLEGLALQRYIALSGDGKDVSAYLASDTLDAVLKAGVTGFGTANEREQVAINHNGTGHFGNLYFAGDHIDFRTSRDADPYLSIGAEDMVPIADFVRSARVDDTPISTSSVQLTTSSKVYQRSVDVADDGTRLTITIDELFADCYDLDYAVLTLDGSNLASWQGNTKIRDDGQMMTDGKTGFIRTPYEAQNLSYERVVSKGRHVVRLELIAKRGQVTFTRFKVKRRYDTGRQQSLLTRSGLRLFGSPDRYLDVDYTPTEKYKLFGQEYTRPNPYIVRIKGGLQVDELDIPGVPLCGASFNENGGQEKAFGKYVNQQGTNRAQAVYYDSGRFYRVYHSIGNKRYIPTIQVVGDNGNDINWNLSARIYAVNANDFAVRIITNGDNPIKHAFSFVAFKTM